MDSPASQRPRELKQPILTFVLVCALLAATLSVTYTLFSSPLRASDLPFFHDITRTWVNGTYNETLRYNVYPPPTPVILSPFGFMSYETFRAVWFVLNLFLTVLSIYLTIRLIGPKWAWQVQYFLLFFVLSWGPFRINLRNGQITTLIMALLLGSLLAWRRNYKALAGFLLGLALCKYTMAFPFLIYLAWKRQWKVALVAVSTFFALTSVYSIRLNLNPITVLVDYARFVSQISTGFSASADFNSLVLSLSGNSRVALGISLFIVLLAVFSFALVVSRKRPTTNVQLALLTLFTLWSVYHRTYDFLLCMIPVAVFLDFLVRRRQIFFSYFWLGMFAMLILALPGLPARVEVDGPSPWRALLIHSERILVFVAFWSLLWVTWKRPPDSNEQPLPVSSQA